MMRGEKVALRARIESDVAVLHAELHDDVVTRARADSRAWRPISPEAAAAPYRISDPADDFAPFSIVELGDGETLAGEAALWGIDQHNRSAHIGLSLRPAFYGRGLGTDTVRVLCEYGFRVRGLHRLGMETLRDNAAMLRIAAKTGFLREGVLRGAAWVNGQFLDEVVFGLLAEEWAQLKSRQASGSGDSGTPGPRTVDDIVDEAGRESFPASDPPVF